MLRLMEERLGIELQVLPPNNLAPILDGVKRGEVDVITSLKTTPERSIFLTFTQPYVVIPTVIVARTGVEPGTRPHELGGKKIAVGKGYGVQGYLESKFPDINLVLVPDDLEGLRKVSFGEVDAVIMDIASASFFIDKEKLTNLHVAGSTDYAYDLSFAIRKDWPILQSILSKTLGEISDTEKQLVLDSWIRLEIDPFTILWSKYNYLIIVFSILTIMGIVMAVAFWIFTLNRTVIKRTADIKANEETLVYITQRGWEESGGNFLDSLVQYLAETLNVDYAFIDVLSSDERTARTISLYALGQFPENIEYGLKWTPCDNVIGKNICCYPKRIQQLFPKDKLLVEMDAESYAGIPLWDSNKNPIGLIAVMDRKPLADPARVKSVLQLVAIRVAQELERMQVEEVLINAKIEAERANEAKTQFLSSMSHELRTPLNAVLGFAQVLELNSQEPLSKKQKKATRQIIRGGEHLLNLVDDVLNLAKIEAGRMDLKIEPIETKRALERCLPMTENLTHSLGVTINTDGFANGVIQADRVRFKQVLFNLISNAVKYNRADGEVIVTSAITEDGMQRISVADTGLGISKERQAGLFEPFSRLGAENSNIEGTGIGLTITQHLLEAMGGRIGFKSHEGVGSTFWVELPLAARPKAEDTEIVGEEAPNTTGTKGNILYVEDSPANAALMESILADLPGVILEIAGTAEVGISTAIKTKPDLILMDINLPGMNGDEALGELRRHDETRDIPVIAISAAAMPNEIQHAMEAGFLAYLTKPFDVTELIKIVSDVLSNEKA